MAEDGLVVRRFSSGPPAPHRGFAEDTEPVWKRPLAGPWTAPRHLAPGAPRAAACSRARHIASPVRSLPDPCAEKEFGRHSWRPNTAIPGRHLADQIFPA